MLAIAVAAAGCAAPPLRSAAEAEALATLQANAPARLLLDGKHQWTGKLAELGGSLHAGRSTAHTDSPSRAVNVSNLVPEAVRGRLLPARSFAQRIENLFFKLFPPSLY